MKKLFAAVVWCGISLTGFTQTSINPKIAPELRAAYQNGENPDVLVVMKDQADVSAAQFIHGKTAKANFVFSALKQKASQTQTKAREILQQKQANANSFYIVNAISVKKCPLEIAQQLCGLEEVKAIAADPAVEMQKPELNAGVTGRSAIEWGVQKINAPSVWDLGYTGQGVTIGGADTGYDWAHPAIKTHYKGYYEPTDTTDHNYHWHDAVHGQNPLNADPNNPCGFDITQPCDDQGHGTHTMGSMTGDDGQGNQIGVAPGASWIGCRNMERGWGQPSTYIECFEWFLAPTDVNGQNPLPSKAPDVINNSWYCAVDEGCTDLTINEMMRQAVINLKASGVFVVVSNGNFGGQGCNSTYGPPAYFEESFSIGSTQESDTISNFSSRGPVTIDGSNRVKPNVSAPGQFVRSCVPNGGYSVFSGTSMAGPHVAGLVALIYSANPDLKGEVAQVEDIIEATCVPLTGLADCSDNNGTDYPNNTYGFGRVDALQAVHMALTVPQITICYGAPFEVMAYPNPATEWINFNIAHQQGNIHLHITDVTGKTVISQNHPSDHNIAISLKGQPRGTYFWKISNATGFSETGRFIVK